MGVSTCSLAPPRRGDLGSEPWSAGNGLPGVVVIRLTRSSRHPTCPYQALTCIQNASTDGSSPRVILPWGTSIVPLLRIPDGD
jgi:hypothetical protein